MAKDKGTALSKKEIEQLQKDLKKLNEFIKTIESMGGKIPGPLKIAVKALELAIKAGVGIGKAADEASKSLRAYEKDLKKACDTVDAEMKMVCEAKIDRKWQARSVEFTLSYKNKDSVTSRSIDKLIKWLTPDAICKHWDRCAKIDKKK